MNRPALPVVNRPCERQCQRCKQWLHHSRFWRRTRKGANGTVCASWFANCKACEQIERNERKNADRPMAIIQARAAAAAGRAGAAREFFWTQMGYHTLVEPFRALLTAGRCQPCGHPFQNERDIQLDHIEPPRSQQDWARLHAGNLRFICGSCNSMKSSKPYAVWLDEQEQARLSNLAAPSTAAAPLPQLTQLSMFGT